MARKPRLHIPGGVYHVMLRGNGGQDIFYSDEDRYRFYLLLQHGVERYGYRIHGFCLMTNHVHLVIQVGEISLSKIIQNISFRYTQWINKRQRRVGHLFQGRYKAILVDADSYLLELVRYIHLNPVRAGMVKTAEDYPWSGHLAYLDAEMLPWLHTDWILGQLAKRIGAARRRYQKFVTQGVGEGRREEFHRGGDDTRILADDRFMEKALCGTVKLRPRRPSVNRVVKIVTKSYRLDEEALRAAGRNRCASEARALIAWLCQKTGAASLEELANRFNRDSSTLCRQVAAIERKRLELSSSNSEFEEYLNTIMQA